MTLHERVWDDNSIRSIYLDEASGGLEVMVDQGDREASLFLNARGVHQLLLALQRYERNQESKKKVGREA